MIFLVSPASSQKHCKKQPAPVLQLFPNRHTSSADKLKIPAIPYATTCKSIMHPSEKISIHLPNISKHIQQKLKTQKRATYEVKLSNTTKSLPALMKLGAYFTSTAEISNNANPELLPMKCSKAQTMF